MREQGLQLNEDGSKWEKIENGEATKTIDFPNEKPLSDANTFSFILIVLSCTQCRRYVFLLRLSYTSNNSIYFYAGWK